MAARTKKSRPRDPHQILVVHMEMSKERDELLQKTQELQRAGKIAEARKTFRAAERVHQRIEEYVRHYRPRNPHADPES